MKIRNKVAAIIAAVIVGGAALAGCTIFDGGVTIGPAAISPLAGGRIVGSVRVHVVNMPRSMQAFVYLEYKFRGKWITEDEAIYTTADLPPVGVTGTLPPLRGQCLPGLWRITGRVLGIMENGKPAHASFAWPSTKGQRIKRCDA